MPVHYSREKKNSSLSVRSFIRLSSSLLSIILLHIQWALFYVWPKYKRDHNINEKPIHICGLVFEWLVNMPYRIRTIACSNKRAREREEKMISLKWLFRISCFVFFIFHFFKEKEKRNKIDGSKIWKEYTVAFCMQHI